MERQNNNFIGERLTRLPPGFRFQPTDHEIVFEYLKCKILSLPLPASIIPDLPLSRFDPWDLPGDPEEERYFFTKKETKYRKGSRANRTTSSGYWKATGSEKHLSPPHQRQNLGTTTMKGLRKTFVFYRGKAPNGRRTDWFMHEYSLILNNAIMPRSCDHHMTSSIHQNFDQGTRSLEDWVICCVFLKQRLEKEDDDMTPIVEYTSDNYANPRNVDGNFANTAYSYSSSSSSSNSITEPSLNELEFQEINYP